MVYPALLPLMRTVRLPVVEWNDAPANLNGLVRFAKKEIWFLRVCHHISKAVYKISPATPPAPTVRQNTRHTRQEMYVSRKSGAFAWPLLQWKYYTAFCKCHAATFHWTIWKYCSTTMILWQIYIASNNKYYAGIHADTLKQMYDRV